MAFSTAQRLMSLGVPGPLAKEMGAQIDSGTYNWKRLVAFSMVPEQARYFEQSMTDGTFTSQRAVSLGFIPSIATLLTGVGVIWSLTALRETLVMRENLRMTDHGA